MKRIAIIITLVFILIHLSAQRINYEFAAPNAAHHEARISVAAEGLPAGPAIFRMSRSSPGRYATHEFGKNVYDVVAEDKTGKPLQIEKIDGDVYRVTNHKGYAKVTYTVFGNHADGTYLGIDPSSYHLNMPAAFMWVKGMDKAPITLRFKISNRDFKIATQLKPTADPNTFTAPGLQYFMDSPVKIAEMKFTEWTVTNPDSRSYQFRLALEAESSDSLADLFTNKIKRVVNEAKAVYGETPSYDYGMYTFLAGINPYVRGDGMEHRNSTMISLPFSFTGSDQLLEVFAHEFFHCWNVERIRPKTIEPFNFEKSNMCDGLWLAEGFTQYYGDMLLIRAGFDDPQSYAGTMAGLITAKEITPGGQLYSPIENSQRAVFSDAAVAVDKTNTPNIFSSYYSYGAAIALALEFELRTKFNKTLDDFMQALWKRFGKTEIPYTMPALEETLARVTADKNFAKDFFKKYIYGHQSFDYAAALQKAGYLLKKANAGKPWIGNITYGVISGEVAIKSATLRNTPIYNAGLDIDDTIIELDGKKVKKQNDIDDILKSHQVGDVLVLSYKHRRQKKETTVMLQGNPSLNIIPVEREGTISAKQQQFRNNWLGSKVK
jgi:predicted metalloprotease with PDZ domain